VNDGGGVSCDDMVGVCRMPASTRYR
jgi:hypothetical protein